MPVFTEFATASRELRVLPSFALPLPRLSPPLEKKEDRYEVVIAGVCEAANKSSTLQVPNLTPLTMRIVGRAGGVDARAIAGTLWTR